MTSMTTQQRAARIAKIVVSGSANAFYVAATQHQQDAVIQEAVRVVLAELQEHEATLPPAPAPLPQRVWADHLGGPGGLSGD